MLLLMGAAPGATPGCERPRLVLAEASSVGSRVAPAATWVARACSTRERALATVGLTA